MVCGLWRGISLKFDLLNWFKIVRESANKSRIHNRVYFSEAYVYTCSSDFDCICDVNF